MKINPRMLGLHGWNCDDPWTLAMRGLTPADAAAQGWCDQGPQVRHNKQTDLAITDALPADYRRLLQEHGSAAAEVAGWARAGIPACEIEAWLQRG